MYADTLDGVLIDVDEDGFYLLCSGENAEYRFKLPAEIAEELMRAVKREIEPWWLEGYGRRPRLTTIEGGDNAA